MSEERILPARALLHPAWILALVLLVANDHIFKHGPHSGLVTGKLSDFAGLFLAPVLLAAILNIGSRRGLYLCAVVVGAIFSAINLSATAAAGWNWMMGVFFFGWHTTVDPTDLVALPMLAIGLWVLLPSMEVKEGKERKFATLLAAVAGGLACLGTSPPPPPPPEIIEPPSFQARVTAVNLTGETLLLGSESFQERVIMDCDVVGTEPAAMVSVNLFGRRGVWPLSTGEQVGLGYVEGGPSPMEGAEYVLTPVQQPCEIALLTSNLSDDVVAFWNHDLSIRSFSYDSGLSEEWTGAAPSFVLRADYLHADREPSDEDSQERCTYYSNGHWDCYSPSWQPIAGATYQWEPASPHLTLAEPRDDEEAGTCEVPGRTPEVAWNMSDLSERSWIIDRVTDDAEHSTCRSYLLDDTDSSGGGGWQGARLCGPQRLHEVLSQAAEQGSILEFRGERGDDGLAELLEISLSQAQAEDVAPEAQRIVLTKGYGLDDLLGISWEESLIEECTPSFDSCFNTWLDTQLQLQGVAEPLRAGGEALLDGDRTLFLGRASYRAVVATQCHLPVFWPSIGMPESPDTYLELMLEER